MPDQRLLLTDKAVDQLPLATTGQYWVHDSELRGFAVLVGRRSKAFMARGEFWRDGKREFSTRVKLGECENLTSREARVKAKDALASIAKGARPGESPATRSGEMTLKEAWERYRDAHMVRKGRSPKTIAGYTDHIERLLKDWLDMPLARLGRTPKLVAEWHDSITEKNGPYMANLCMRSLRAIYNHALKSDLSLPHRNPVAAIDWNGEARRDTGMGPDDLPNWLTSLHGLSNPVRREFDLFSVLSGSLPDALRKVRIEHIDLKRRVLHFPEPKGGKKKAFDISLSRPMIRCIIRVLRAGRVLFADQNEFWLFPADSAEGHLIEYKEDRSILPKWGNDLRQTYRTLAQVAGLSEIDVHLLMNHSLPGVNAGYITRERLLNNHLRSQQQSVSQLVVAAACKAGADSKSSVSSWLSGSKFPIG